LITARHAWQPPSTILVAFDQVVAGAIRGGLETERGGFCAAFGCRSVYSGWLEWIVTAVFSFLRQSAKTELGLRRLDQAHPGAIVALQRFGCGAKPEYSYPRFGQRRRLSHQQGFRLAEICVGIEASVSGRDLRDPAVCRPKHRATTAHDVVSNQKPSREFRIGEIADAVARIMRRTHRHRYHTRGFISLMPTSNVASAAGVSSGTITKLEVNPDRRMVVALNDVSAFSCTGSANQYAGI
jgi:hypothetical protein